MKIHRIVTLILIFLFFLIQATDVTIVHSQTTNQLKLVLKLPLKSIGADGSQYPVYVEIQNMDGEPVQLNYDITIKLFSSDTRVATVPDEIIFPRGAFYTTFNLRTTYNPGTTEITALSPGFESGKLVVKTQLSVGYPKRLAVFVYPRSLIPSPSESAYIVVQLQDSMGKPSRAPSNIDINLYLSNPLVGSPAETTITITKGSTYGYTIFNPTTIPGSTVITATAPGLESGYASVTTVGPTPEILVVEASPSKLPSVGRDSSFIYITAYLVDRNGYPAWASSDIDIIFTSSNTSLAYFKTTTLTIHPGEFYVRNKLYSSGEDLSGTVEVTVQAKGLVSSRTTVEVSPPSNATGGSLTVYISPSVYPPGELTYSDSIVVQLIDQGGKPIIADSSVTVYLSSSNPMYGYPVETTVSVAKGSSIASADITASKLVGTTTITASADNFRSADGSIEIKAPPPVKVKLGLGPSDIRATGDTYPFLYVQLQDEQGRPTTAQDDIVVELSSSNDQFGDVPDKVTIPRGSSFTIVDFISTTIQGVTNITASATGFEPDSIEVKTIEPFPSILSAVAYTNFVADGGVYPIYIQLLDISGRPAKPELPIEISLVSSDPNVVTLPSEITLEEGTPYAVVQVTTSLTPGEVTVSIAASGYTPTSISLRSILLPLTVEIDAPKNNMLFNETLQFTIYATHKGVPVEQVQITIDSNYGDVTDGGYTRMDGTLSGVYTPVLPGDDAIKVLASKAGYEPAYAELKIYIDKYITIKVRAETLDGVSISGVEVTVVDSYGVVHSGVTGDDGWIVFKNMKWGHIEIAVGKNYTTGDTKYLFNRWSEGTTESTWIGNVVNDLTLRALYNVMYRIDVYSEYGNTYGSGWYPKGTSVTVGVEETSISINPLIYKKFSGWSGDISANNPTITIVVDSPKTVSAVWVDDYLYLYMFLGVVAIGGGTSGTIFFLYRKGKVFKKYRGPPEAEEEVGLEEYFMIEEEVPREEVVEERVEEKLVEEVEEKAPEEAEEVKEEGPDEVSEEGEEPDAEEEAPS